jgi:hypothetical protein
MKKVFIILGILTGIVIIIIIQRTHVFNVMSELHDQFQINEKLDSNIFSSKIPKEYAELFKDSSKVKIYQTTEGKRRNAISEFYYNNKFYIQIYKIDYIKNLSINDLIKVSNAGTSISHNVGYLELTDKRIDISYKIGPRNKNITNLYFNLHGDPTYILLKNDSIAYYYSNASNFSIKYKLDSPYDIYGKTKDNVGEQKSPVEIMFLKRHDNLYFILLSSKVGDLTMDTYALYNLIIGKK